MYKTQLSGSPQKTFQNIFIPLSAFPFSLSNYSFLMFLLWILFSLTATPSLKGEPLLMRLEPSGAQRGQPFQLTLIGTNLPTNSQIISTLPATFTSLSQSVPEDIDAQKDTALPFLVELEKNVPIGIYPIRVVTAEGMSNLLLFSVGTFPEITEKEAQSMGLQVSNDSPNQSQLIDSVPVTVNGSLDGPDRDVYHIFGQKGQRIVLEVEARRLGSAIDPVLRVLDSQFKQIFINDDTPSIGIDCRLDISFPLDGSYYVVVHDARFSQQDQNFYRLKIGTSSYAQGLFPLGWKRGEKTRVMLFGGSLADSIEVNVDLTQINDQDDFVPVSLPGELDSIPFNFVVGDLPEILESPKSGVSILQPSTVVNGLISEPSEIDQYHLPVTPGEIWLITLDAAGLGTSRLAAVLTVFAEDGRRLASSGDEVPDPDAFSVISPGRISLDPFIPLVVPEDVKSILISVEDLADRGGPLYGYRLLAERQPLDFTLTLSTPFLNIPAGGTGSVSVIAHRRGYMGPIQLTTSGNGDGLAVEGGFIPAEIDDPDNRKLSRQGVLTITANPNAVSRLQELSVWGEAQLEKGTKIRRRARGPGLITTIRGGTGAPDPNRRDNQEPFTAPWLGLELPLMVSAPIPGHLEVEGPSKIRVLQGMEHEIHWRFNSQELNLRPPRKISINRPGSREIRTRIADPDAEYLENGIVTLSTTVGTPPSKFNVILAGEINVQGSKKTLYTPAITVEVVQGYHITTPIEGFQLTSGGRLKLVAQILREPAFHAPIEVKIENLPLGVSCESTVVAENINQLQVECKAEARSLPGEYSIQLTSSSLLAGRDKEKVPYRIPPVHTQLRVTTQNSTQKVSQIQR